MLYTWYESQHKLWAIWDPNARNHIVKNFMVLNLAWGWLFKSKRVALTYALII